MLTASSLQGLHVPVITPFHPDGQLDLPSYRNHIQELLQYRIHGLVVGGTTGESPSLTWEEVEILYAETRKVLREAGANLPVILGTGTNNTAESLRRTKRALTLGADAALVVVPYYNRPSAAGVIEHYRALGEAGIPVIAYNIPYRTGLELSAATIRDILALPHVIGLKDSSGGIRQLIELSPCPTASILCGEDMYGIAALCSGAQGGILASLCAAPGQWVRIYEQVQAGEITSAREEFEQLVPLIDLLYREPNPAPLKWLLAHRGVIRSSELRLPMVGISDILQQQLSRY